MAEKENMLLEDTINVVLEEVSVIDIASVSPQLLRIETLKNEKSSTLREYYGGGLSTLTFRGTHAQHSTVTWAGENISSPFLGLYDLSLLAVFDFTNYQLSDGGGSIGGNLQVLHRPIENKVYLKLELGSFSTQKNEWGLSWKNENSNRFIWAHRIAFQHRSSENNYKYTDDRNQQRRLENASFDFKNVSYENTLTFKTKEDVLVANLKFNALYQNYQRRLPFDRPNSFQKDENARFVANYEHRFQQNWSFASRLGYFYESILYNQDLSRLNALFLSLETKKKWTSRQGKNVFWLANFKNRQNTGQTPYYEGTEIQYLMDLESEIEFSDDRKSIKIGASQEWMNGERMPFDTHFGLKKQWKGLNLSANIARQHRTPTLNDRFWQPGGNPDLLAEKAWNFETKATHRTNVDGQKKLVLESEAALFVKQIDDYIQWSPIDNGGIWTPQNLKKVNIRGAETSFEVIFRPQKTFFYSSKISGQWVQSINTESYLPKDASEGKQLMYVPTFTANWLNSLKINEFEASVNYNYQSLQFTSTDNSREIEGFGMLDFSLIRTIKMPSHQILIEGSILNLLNKNFQTYANRWGAGRNFRLAITFQFL